jgi:hypothetical protein
VDVKLLEGAVQAVLVVAVMAGLAVQALLTVSLRLPMDTQHLPVEEVLAGLAVVRRVGRGCCETFEKG